MSPTNNVENGKSVKTLAIRLDGEQHAQLSMIAQLEGLTMIDAIRQAIDAWVAARRDNPELKARAQSLLEDIELEAANRKDALAALLGEQPTEAGGAADQTEKDEPSGTGRPRRSTTPSGR